MKHKIENLKWNIEELGDRIQAKTATATDLNEIVQLKADVDVLEREVLDLESELDEANTSLERLAASVGGDSLEDLDPAVVRGRENSAWQRLTGAPPPRSVMDRPAAFV